MGSVHCKGGGSDFRPSILGWVGRDFPGALVFTFNFIPDTPSSYQISSLSETS